MSKYPTKISINNPEKNVSNDMIEQFFLTLRNGNINEIKNFVLENKIKYNLVDAVSKDSSRETPYHTILRLDNKIANNSAKYKIIKFLEQMGSPLNLPDSKNIWPIHLAVLTQSIKIVDFFVGKNANLNVKDASNNTPLHYAVIGNEVACKKNLTVSSLVPNQKFDQLNLNKILENVNTLINNLLKSQINSKNNLENIVNTIMKIPKMYENDKYYRTLEEQITTILTNAFLDVKYINDSTKIQSNLDDLVMQTIIKLKSDVLQNVTEPLNIFANNVGWAPIIADSNGVIIDSSRKQQILDMNVTDYYNNLTQIYTTNKTKIFESYSTIFFETIDNDMQNIINNIDYHIDKLIFGNPANNANSNKSNIYAQPVTLAKMFYLLSLNKYKNGYATFFANKIMNNFKFIDNTDNQHNAIIGNNNYRYDHSINTLWFSDLFDIYNDLRNSNNTNVFDDCIFQYAQFENNIYFNCIKEKLNALVSYKDDEYVQADSEINIYYTILNQPLNILYKDPNYSELLHESDSQINEKQTWIQLLKRVSQRIMDTPDPYRLIANRKTNIYNTFLILNTLLQIALNNIEFNDDEYIYDYPTILQYNINDWLDSVNAQFNDNQVLQNYGDLLVVSKIFYKFVQIRIKNIITNCIQSLINNALSNEDTNNVTQNMHLLFSQFTDGDMIYLLLPGNPNTASFMNSTNSLLSNAKSNQWTNDNVLIQLFHRYYDSFDDDDSDLINQIDNNYQNIVEQAQNNGVDYATYLNELRINFIQFMENNNISVILNDFEFIKLITNYFDSNNIIDTYNYTIDDTVFDNNNNQIPSNIDILMQQYYLTQIYGDYYVSIKRYINNIKKLITTASTIIADANVYINSSMYYYIPQIFLPAYIKTLFDIHKLIHNLQDDGNFFINKISQALAYVDMSDRQIKNIIGSSRGLNIDNVIAILNDTLKKIASSHDDIINFLNLHSAYNQIIQYLNNGTNDINVSQIFDTNLTLFDDIIDVDDTSNLLGKYKISKTNYYFNESPNYNTFDIQVFGNLKEANMHKNYRNVLSYTRDNPETQTFTPTIADNSQINIIENDDGSYNFYEIFDSINGAWLYANAENTNINYHDAFIAPIFKPYKLKWTDGMLSSIKELMSAHLIIVKQLTIQDTLQYILNNRFLPNTDSQSTKKIFDELAKLKNNGDYSFDIVQINIVVAKLIDATINKIIDYTIRQSVVQLINNFVSNNKKLSDVAIHTLITDPTNLKISLHETNNTLINNILTNSPHNINYALTQIENDPNKLLYVNKSKKFIKYLYDINYFTQSSDNSYGKCYNINPKIVEKLINADTIGEKNMDGYTPLHLAVITNNPETVKILMNCGIKQHHNESACKFIKTLVDNKHRTPLYFALSEFNNHLNYLDGYTNAQYYSEFIYSFNDLYISKIRSDKFGNNILKYSTFGVPIQLLMYNHMFNVYLRNYRYNFTFELAKNIDTLYKKYYGTQSNVYPIDLFDIKYDDLIRVFENEDPRVAVKHNNIESKKILNLKNKLKMFENQKAQLSKELQESRKSNEYKYINDLLNLVNQEILEINDKINDNANTNIQAQPNSTLINIYKTKIDALHEIFKYRSIDLVEFYDNAFNNITHNKNTQIAIWNYYLNKPATQSPSMIFSLIHTSINNIVYALQTNIVNNELLQELHTNLEFMTLVNEYIKLKGSFPNTINDNPIIEQELAQIKYLINLILTPATINIIIATVYNGLREMDALSEITNNADHVYNEISNSRFNGYTIAEYVKNILPDRVIKYYITIYNTPNDVDKIYVNDFDIFMPIINIIKANRLVHLNNDSIVIKNITQYLIPFLTTNYKNFIDIVNTTRFSFEKYLLNTYQLLKIIDSLVE